MQMGQQTYDKKLIMPLIGDITTSIETISVCITDKTTKLVSCVLSVSFYSKLKGDDYSKTVLITDIR